jgi:hypothetical protein
MLIAATVVLGFAVVIGGAAAVSWLGRDARPPAWWLAAAHGTVALAGLALLVIALPGARRGAATGTQSFGAIAAMLLAAAALIGLGMLASRVRRRRVAGAFVGLHATLAIAGFVVLAVYLMLG